MERRIGRILVDVYYEHDVLNFLKNMIYYTGSLY